MDIEKRESLKKLKRWRMKLVTTEELPFNLYSWCSKVEKKGKSSFTTILSDDPLRSEEKGFLGCNGELGGIKGAVNILLDCGFAGCAAGWLPAFFPEEWGFSANMEPALKKNMDENGYCTDDGDYTPDTDNSLQEFFNIDSDYINYIVLPHYYKENFLKSDWDNNPSNVEGKTRITKDMAALHIQHVIDHIEADNPYHEFVTRMSDAQRHKPGPNKPKPAFELLEFDDDDLLF